MAADARTMLAQLGSTPATPPTSAAQPDPVRALLDEIDDMRSTGTYEWADQTLTGIYDTVRRTQHVTPGQLQTVQNIRDVRSRSADDEVEYGERNRRRRSTAGVYRSVKP